METIYATMVVTPARALLLCICFNSLLTDTTENWQYLQADTTNAPKPTYSHNFRQTQERSTAVVIGERSSVTIATSSLTWRKTEQAVNRTPCVQGWIRLSRGSILFAQKMGPPPPSSRGFVRGKSAPLLIIDCRGSHRVIGGTQVWFLDIC